MGLRSGRSPSFVGRSIYAREGSRLDLNFVCSIALCTLMRELWASKGRLPFPSRMAVRRAWLAKHAIKAALAPISALEICRRTGTVGPFAAPSATPAPRRRLAPNSRKLCTLPGPRSPSARRTEAPPHAQPQRAAWDSAKGHSPEFWGPESSLRRCRRVAVNPRREEAKIAAR